MTRLSLAVCIFCAVCLVACEKYIKVDGYDMHETYYNAAIAQVENQFSYVFNCNKGRFKTRILSQFYNQLFGPKSIGVDGCGYRVMYVNISTGSYGGKWVVNTKSKID